MDVRGSLRSALLLAGIIGSVSAAGPTFGEDNPGDVTVGKKVFFSRCLGCHEPPSTVGLTAEEVAQNEAALPADEAVPTRGPSLAHLIGRTAGTLPGYTFSDAMKASGVVWTDETLRVFLLKPSAFIPRNKMPFNGIKREGEMDALIPYLLDAAK